MKIGIIGSGGVGGFHAHALIEAGAEVHIITTPRHVEAIGRDGLRLRIGAEERTARPASVSSDGAGVGLCDFLLITVKLDALDAALHTARRLAGPSTLIVTTENGVVAPARAHEAFGPERVVPAVTFIVAFVEAPGVIRALTPRPRLVLASHPLAPARGAAERIRSFADLIGGSAVTLELDDSISHLLWVKFALICTMGGVNILANATTGEVMGHPDTRALVARSIDEVALVAAAHGVDLSAGDRSAIIRRLASLDPASTTSMQRDLREGRPSELEYLNGDLVARARAHGIDLPLHEAVLAVSRLHAERGHV